MPQGSVFCPFFFFTEDIQFGKKGNKTFLGGAGGEIEHPFISLFVLFSFIPTSLCETRRLIGTNWPFLCANHVLHSVGLRR